MPHQSYKIAISSPRVHQNSTKMGKFWGKKDRDLRPDSPDGMGSMLTDEADDDSFGPAPPPPSHPHPEDADGMVASDSGYDAMSDDQFHNEGMKFEDMPKEEDIDIEKGDDPPAEKTMEESMDEGDEDDEDESIDYEEDQSVEIPPTTVVQRMLKREQMGDDKNGRRLLGCGGMLLCCMAIVAIVLGAGFGTGAFKKDSGDSTSRGAPAPSNPDNSGVDFDRAAAITALISSFNAKGEATFQDPQAPESLALAWLIADDPLQLDPTLANDQFRLGQRYALLSLWFGSFTWSDESGWLVEGDECTWFGVTCESQDIGGDFGVQNVVVDIDLQGNNVSGAIPLDFALLTYLRVLNLANNLLEGTLPITFGFLVRLEELYLDRNLFAEDLTEYNFASMVSLRRLDLSSNSFFGPLPPSLWQTVTLELLVLDNNDFTGEIPADIANLVNLCKSYGGLVENLDEPMILTILF